jgi:hypothetical protein
MAGARERPDGASADPSEPDHGHFAHDADLNPIRCA